MKIQNLKWKLFLSVAILIYAIILYRFRISCPILTVFGIPCPGCGMTRALLSAVRLELQTAFSHHWMFWSLPILYLCYLFDGNLFLRKAGNIMLYSALGIGFLLNWIVRL